MRKTLSSGYLHRCRFPNLNILPLIEGCVTHSTAPKQMKNHGSKHNKPYDDTQRRKRRQMVPSLTPRSLRFLLSSRLSSVLATSGAEFMSISVQHRFSW